MAGFGFAARRGGRLEPRQQRRGRFISRAFTFVFDLFVSCLSIGSPSVITKLITNRISQEQFQTLLLGITKKEIPRLDKKIWSFDWKKEAKLTHRVVHKLTTTENPDVIQGLISWSDFGDHIFVNLVESAPFNRGSERLYQGVAGNLFAFACQESFAKGYDGFIVFESKTKLVNHYRELLGAQRLGSSIRMFVDTRAAQHLVKLYL